MTGCGVSFGTNSPNQAPGMAGRPARSRFGTLGSLPAPWATGSERADLAALGIGISVGSNMISRRPARMSATLSEAPLVGHVQQLDAVGALDHRAGQVELRADAAAAIAQLAGIGLA